MAERRMLTRKVTDDDHFINLSSSAQALYLHLTMSADDDGFNNQVSVCMFRAHASTQDLQSLLENRYLLQFENGVIVIKHWRMANSLRKDRYNPTSFQDEFARLSLNQNGDYTLNTGLPDGCQVVASSAPQVRLGKVRLGKDKDKKEERRAKTRRGAERNIENLKDLNIEPRFMTSLEAIRPGLERWVVYKGEKGFSYTPTGLKTLAMMACRNTEQYGAEAVEMVIDESIANGYQGIVWDRLSKVKGKAHNFTERSDDLDEMAVASMREMLTHGG